SPAVPIAFPPGDPHSRLAVDGCRRCYRRIELSKFGRVVLHLVPVEQCSSAIARIPYFSDCGILIDVDQLFERLAWAFSRTCDSTGGCSYVLCVRDSPDVLVHPHATRCRNLSRPIIVERDSMAFRIDSSNNKARAFVQRANRSFSESLKRSVNPLVDSWIDSEVSSDIVTHRASSRLLQEN
ncbi:hypothetical protein PENTCL1PPCAC_979, partial [Pristionchus entomophagus]